MYGCDEKIGVLCKDCRRKKCTTEQLGGGGNRRFPRSMRSQGERPGCGSHVKRVDHGDAFNA